LFYQEEAHEQLNDKTKWTDTGSIQMTSRNTLAQCPTSVSPDGSRR